MRESPIKFEAWVKITAPALCRCNLQLYFGYNTREMGSKAWKLPITVFKDSNTISFGRFILTILKGFLVLTEFGFKWNLI